MSVVQTDAGARAQVFADAQAGAARVVVFNNMITPYTNRLYNQLASEGVNIAVLSCCAEESNRSWARAISPSYPHEVLKGVSFRLSPSRYAHVNVGISAALDRLSPDLLIVNGFYPSMVMAAVWAARCRIPIALMMDGWREVMPQSAYHRLVRPTMMKRFRAIATCGMKGRAYFLAQGVAGDRIFILPIVPAWDAPKQIPPLDARPYHLLWAARMNDEEKNASFFVDVAVALKARIPELTVRLVGRGAAEAAMIERLARAGIPYRHEPHVDWHQMPEVYCSARVLALPSRLEPWGLVCNEAMQCGVPCVVSPHVGASDDAVISGRNGEVVRLEVAGWVNVIERILRDPGIWSNMSQNGRADMRARSLAATVGSFRGMTARALAAH